MIKGSRVIDISLNNYLNILKPCPFCGKKELDSYCEENWFSETNSENDLVLANRIYTISCSNCEIDMETDPIDISEFNDIVKKWNMRNGEADGVSVRLSN